MTDRREHELLEQVRARDEIIKELELAVSRLTDELRRSQTESELLKHKLDRALHRLFGKKSEQLDPAELQLLFQGLLENPAEVKDPVAPAPPEVLILPSPSKMDARRAPKERKPRLPDHLPIVEETILPAQVQAAPELWKKIGEEVTERLDFTPAQFTRLRTIRPKYVPRESTDEAKPVIAPLPACILERSILTPGLLAQILVAKYCDHLPLYRQQSIFSIRHGVEISRQTMAQWVEVGATWLRLIFEEIGKGVRASGNGVQSFVETFELSKHLDVRRRLLLTLKSFDCIIVPRFG